MKKDTRPHLWVTKEGVLVRGDLLDKKNIKIFESAAKILSQITRRYQAAREK